MSNCNTCPYFGAIEGRRDYGQCKRRAPARSRFAAAVGLHKLAKGVQRQWPLVRAEKDWCGEHPARVAAAQVAFGGELAALMPDEDVDFG